MQTSLYSCFLHYFADNEYLIYNRSAFLNSTFVQAYLSFGTWYNSVLQYVCQYLQIVQKNDIVLIIQLFPFYKLSRSQLSPNIQASFPTFILSQSACTEILNQLQILSFLMNIVYPLCFVTFHSLHNSLNSSRLNSLISNCVAHFTSLSIFYFSHLLFSSSSKYCLHLPKPASNLPRFHLLHSYNSFSLVGRYLSIAICFSNSVSLYPVGCCIIFSQASFIY